MQVHAPDLGSLDSGSRKTSGKPSISIKLRVILVVAKSFDCPEILWRAFQFRYNINDLHHRRLYENTTQILDQKAWE